MMTFFKSIFKRKLGRTAKPIKRRTHLTEVEFTQQFMEQLQASILSVTAVEESPLAVKIIIKQEEHGTLFLDNAYGRYRGNLFDLNTILVDQIASVRASLQTENPFTDTSIMPVIKPFDYLDVVKNQLEQAHVKDENLSFVFEKLNDDLLIFYFVDTEVNMRNLSREEFATHFDSDMKKLHDVAIRNFGFYLKEHKVEIIPMKSPEDSHVFRLKIDENYEATLILLTHIWADSNFKIMGKTVVFVAARNILLVTGSEDAMGLETAAQMAQKFVEECSYPISAKGFILESDKWVAFTQ